MTEYLLSDGNVALRPIQESDVEFFWKLDLEPKPFDGNGLAAKGFVKNGYNKGYFWGDTSRVYVIELQQDDGGPVGVIGTKIAKKTTRIEIGTTIAARWRARGIGTRAKRLLVDYLYRAYSCHRITSNTSALNEPAIRSLEKSGFVHEGTARRDRFVHGAFRDYAYFSLLREEYEEARKSWQLDGNTAPIAPRAVTADEEPQYVIKGKLIQIRPIEPEHIPFITELFTFAFPYNHQDLYSVDEMKKEHEGEDSLWGDKNRVFLIETHDGAPIGKVGLWEYDKQNKCVEVGTLIIPLDGRGKGYGTEAKLLAMGYAFDVWPIERISAGTNQYNRGARCSLSRAGLRLWGATAGVQVGARVPAGAAVYSVTRDEWMNAREVRDA